MFDKRIKTGDPKGTPIEEAHWQQGLDEITVSSKADDRGGCERLPRFPELPGRRADNCPQPAADCTVPHDDADAVGSEITYGLLAPRP